MPDENKPTRLVFLDMEMTGLNPETDRILEVAAAIVECTPAGLEAAIASLRAVGARFSKALPVARWGNFSGVPCFWSVIAQPSGVLDQMNAWCQEHHAASGLTAQVQACTATRNDVEAYFVAWLMDNGFAKGEAVLAGNTIHFDRAFIRRWMPDLDAFLHYWLFDVSSVREFLLQTLQRAVTVGGPLPDHAWKAALRRAYDYALRKKNGPDDDAHRALPDVIAAIEELQVYYDVLLS